MTTTPAWVNTLTPADLAHRFGYETLRRGESYAEQGSVHNVRTSGALVMASVRGSAVHPYQATVVCQAGPASLVATCTCPMRRDCKHAAAVIAHLRAGAPRASQAPWQQALTPLLRRSAPGRGGVRLALQVDLSAGSPSLRPLREGQRGGWVKTGANWDELRWGRIDFDPIQSEALLALAESRRRNDFSYGYRTDALPLAELAPDAWTLLRRVVDAGVPLLPGTGAAGTPVAQPVLASEPFEPVILVEPQQGGIRVQTAVRQGEDEFVLHRGAFVGRPPHGLAFTYEGQLMLGALTRPLDEAEQRLFTGTGPLTVPASDFGLFATGFLPQLRQRLAVEVDPTLDLPEALPPRLKCRVDFGARTASVHWSFLYGVGGTTHELGLTARADEPPVRNPDAEAALAASVPEGPWVGPAADGAPELRPAFLTGRPLIDFVSSTLPALQDREDVDVVLNSEPPAFNEATEAPQVKLAVTDSPAGDWFNLDVEITIAGEKVPFADLFRALALGDDHLMLDSGTWFELDRPELDQLRALIAEARELVETDGDTFRLRPEHAGLWEELVKLGVIAEQSAAWQSAVGALLDLDELPDAPVPAGLRADLRPYQLVGYRWLSFLWQTRLGGVLADEMGLGKTVQALALAQAAHEAGELGRPMLVVAPTSVLGTWASEAARFAPELRVVAVTETDRRRGVPLTEAIDGAQVVITSYTLLRLEADAYRELEWSAVLLDEAQFVKNYASKAYQAVRKLRARIKVALTGTPLENNLMDLWSMLSITAPGLFPDPKKFTTVFRKPIESGDADALARLHRRIRPLMLRRTKSSVVKELPDKQEQVVPIELSPGHRRLYDKHLARERQKVLGLVGDLNRNRITILRSLTLLRQLSLSPALIDQSYPVQSAKIDALVELLDDVTSEGHRALVFSQFTGFLGLVKKRLDAEGITYSYLDGRTRDRAERIGRFKTGDDPVFLISLKAGGFGLTLTEADYVFILDPWWNPAAETQAIDRTHRIGQDKPVNVYRLVAADTIEEKVVALQQRKRDLFDSVVGTASDIAAPLSADDIRGLLDV